MFTTRRILQFELFTLYPSIMVKQNEGKC